MCDRNNIDKDKDGLIELCSLEGIDAMRNDDLSGRSYSTRTGVMGITKGCKTGGCIGYELMRNLDFADDASYATTANKMEWTVDDYSDSSDTGWPPIGDNNNRFAATFDGNGYTISNLMINSPSRNIGLFSVSKTGANVTNVGLLDIDVRGDRGKTAFSGLVGSNNGNITNSYVTGVVLVNPRGAGSAQHIGGLTGVNNGNITNSYATVALRLGGLENIVGGLTGSNFRNITNSYATGVVSGRHNIGGLVGDNKGSITNSYTTGGSLVGTDSGTIDKGSGDRTPVQMQMPIAPGTTASGVYYNWSTDNWDFGNSSEYPILKLSDGSGALLRGQRYQLNELVIIDGDRRIALDTRQSDHREVVQMRQFSVIASTATAATITIDGDSVQSSQEKIFTLATGSTSKTITIVATPPDASKLRTYNIKVRRYSSELSGLQVSADEELKPSFDKEVFLYTIRADNSNTAITVTPTAHDFDAQISVDDSSVDSGEASDPIVLPQNATTTIIITVTSNAPAPQTTTYTIAVFRLLPSSDASLSKLELSDGSLDFNPNTLEYSVGVSTDSITVTAEATHAHATIKIEVNNMVVAPSQIPLTPNEVTTITIVVTAQDGTTEDYILTINHTTGIRIRTKVFLEGPLQ